MGGRRSFMPPARDADTFEQIGYANSCCMVFMGFLTIIFTTFLSSNVYVQFYSNRGPCYSVLVCCWYPCTRYCWENTCSTVWRSTRPIVQDMLPAPELDPDFSNSTHDVYLTDVGDGVLDYWSLMVAAVLGPIAGLVMIVVACGGAKRNVSGLCTAFAFILHATAAICLGVQFFENHSSYTFYNYFRLPHPYVNITDSSIVGAMRDDNAYDGFGSLVIAAFTFMLCMTLQECCWLATLVKGDDRLVRPPHSRYSR